MLSVGDLVAVDDRTLRVALWPGTRTGGNLSRQAATMLCSVMPGSVRYVRARPSRLAAGADAPVECFELEVLSVHDDKHEGMAVTSGITFALDGLSTESVVASWRDQLDTLAKAHG
jgi:hypothetical protein